MKEILEARTEIQHALPITTTSVVEMATPNVLDLAIESGYSGTAWLEIQRRLVVRAFPDLERAIVNGTIYRRCARAGVRIRPRKELQLHPYPEDIAAEAVETCLHRFRERVLPSGQWDPERGASLEDFFCVCCLPDVANRWRWHLRRLPEISIPLEAVSGDQILALPFGAGADPANHVENEDLAARILAPMKPVDQKAFTLLAAGWTPEEIAHTLGISRNTFDARISRARKAARTRRTW